MAAEQPFHEYEQVRSATRELHRRQAAVLATQNDRRGKHSDIPAAEADDLAQLQRFFLAEIIKTSLVPPNELLRFIQEREILPRWNAMALPNGT